MKFKTPKSKDVMTVGKALLAFEGGKRVGRGIVGAIPAKDNDQSQLIKGGTAAVALLAAAAYKGGSADIVLPALVGLATEQLGDVIDTQAAKLITKEANPAMPQKFMQDAMGLGCPCDTVDAAWWTDDQTAYTPGINPGDSWSNGNVEPYPFPRLNAPVIREIEWADVYDGSESENSWGSGI